MTAGTGVRTSRVHVGPDPLEEVVAAVQAGGSTFVDSLSGADAIVWFGRDPEVLDRELPAELRWLQIPDAGAEKWLRAGFLNRGFVVTCAGGVYGAQVAEHAVALLLACTHGIATFARASSWVPKAGEVRTLAGAEVTIVGAGGIGTALIGMLRPLGCHISVVTRSGREVPGADRSVGRAGLDEALSEADVVVLAAPATPDTVGLISDRTLALMKPRAILVNVARGSLIDSDALLRALDRGHLSAVALDVTDPEPLPEGHAFFSHPKVLITPHVANPPGLKRASFARHVQENCRRFNAGEPLLGIIEPVRGY